MVKHKVIVTSSQDCTVKLWTMHGEYIGKVSNLLFMNEVVSACLNLGFQIIRTMKAVLDQTLQQDTNKSGRVSSVFLSWVYFR